MVNLTTRKKIMTHSKKIFLLSAAFLTAIALGSPANAGVLLTFDSSSVSSNNPPTGASGTAELSFAAVGSDVRVSVEVTNTTGLIPSFGAGATASKLTGVGFDILGLVYEGGFIGGNFLDTAIQPASLPPFGTFDFAGADNSNFLGGNANAALPAGGVDTFSFLLSGLNAVDMEAAFENAYELSDPLLGSAVMRFQQVNAGAGSDKLFLGPPGTTPPVPGPGGNVPEPSSMAIFGALGLLGLASRRRRGAQKQA
jgi:hypothetical protein